jgi:hypothetical protein
MMSGRQVNKVMATAGSLFAVNGALLLLSPPRFARLRKSSWMPDPVQDALDWLAEHDRTGRMIGTTAALLGGTLLAASLLRTRPA